MVYIQRWSATNSQDVIRLSSKVILGTQCCSPFRLCRMIRGLNEIWMRHPHLSIFNQGIAKCGEKKCHGKWVFLLPWRTRLGWFYFRILYHTSFYFSHGNRHHVIFHGFCIYFLNHLFPKVYHIYLHLS